MTWTDLWSLKKQVDSNDEYIVEETPNSRVVPDDGFTIDKNSCYKARDNRNILNSCDPQSMKAVSPVSFFILKNLHFKFHTHTHIYIIQFKTLGQKTY